MFYLSKGEQAALFVLLAFFLAGAGVLIYHQGVAAGRAQQTGALLEEAPAAPSPASSSEYASPASLPPPGAEGTPSSPSPLPSPGEGESGRGETKKNTSTPARKIHLNTATMAQLDSLPGVGPVIARRILAYREQLRRKNGKGFTSVDELLNVTGIGAKRLHALRERVTL